MGRKLTYFLMLDEKFMNETVKNPFDLKDGDRIDLVHIFERHVYFNELSSYSYPPPEQEDGIKKSILAVLDGVKEKLEKESGAKIDIHCHCIFSHIPKETAVKFLEDNSSDIAVVATRERDGIMGLFTSSFTDYLCRHGKADIYVTRHHDN